MAETNQKSNTNVIAAVIVSAIGLLMLLGWYFFPNW
jgi:hypothetical protein